MHLASVASLDANMFRDADSALRYLQQRYRIARCVSKEMPPFGTISGNIVALYEQIIEPCIRYSSPYALVLPGDFNGPIRTLFVADVVGEEAPVTTIYDAIAMIITLSETSVHTHPEDHDYYKKLVGLYTYICVLVQSKLTFGPAHLLPTAAIVVYGNIGPFAKRIPGFLGSHACSLSTSLPGFRDGLYFGLKYSALDARRDFMQRVMPRYTHYLGTIHQNIVRNLECAEGWAPGNCAETLPITRRSAEGCDILWGVCIYMNQLELAMQGQPIGPEVCTHCSLMANCLSSPYVDMVHHNVSPRSVMPKKFEPFGVSTIDPPAWNRRVARDAAWKQLILRHTLSISNSTPSYTFPSSLFRDLLRLPPPSKTPATPLRRAHVAGVLDFPTRPPQRTSS